MPAISMFYGIIIYMYYMDNKHHNKPHIHVDYQGQKAVFSIPEGKLIAGEIDRKRRKLVEAWVALHEDELMANWKLAINGEEIYKIDPL